MSQYVYNKTHYLQTYRILSILKNRIRIDTDVHFTINVKISELRFGATCTGHHKVTK